MPQLIWLQARPTCAFETGSPAQPPFDSGSFFLLQMSPPPASWIAVSRSYQPFRFLRFFRSLCEKRLASLATLCFLRFSSSWTISAPLGIVLKTADDRRPPALDFLVSLVHRHVLTSPSLSGFPARSSFVILNLMDAASLFTWWS